MNSGHKKDIQKISKGLSKKAIGSHSVVSLWYFTNSSSKIVFKPHPGPEVEVRVPDINKAKKILKFRPKVGLEEGLKNSIEWYQRN